MHRRYLALGIVVGLIVGVVYMLGAARSLPNDDSTGPEGNVYGIGHFEFMFDVGNGSTLANSTVREVSTDRYFLADGWDFGDRAAYRCGWAEYFQGSNEKFEVTFKGVSNYSGSFQINDKFGAQLPGDDPSVDTKLMCWEDPLKGTNFVADGTDHFPHMIHAGDGLTFYQDGEPMLDAQGDPVFIDLRQPDCAKLYWVPGDEPGEAWLWWDEDGPTFSHGEGEGDLGCGGGPMEAVAIVQATVRHADPGIGYCTVSLHEEQCFNAEPPPTPVQLGSGTSILTCPDTSTPVVESTEPLLVTCE
jgi:hypothetical protein